MSTDTFVRFRDLIYEKTGIYYPENKKYVLDTRLEARLAERHCSTFEDYLALLKSDGWRDKELPAFFNVVTTNETFFFRDLPQLQAFNELIVPSVMKENQGMKRLRIWSAACSSGDEPYTLAIQLMERQRTGQGPVSAGPGWAGVTGQGPVSAGPGWAGVTGQGPVSAGPGWAGIKGACQPDLAGWSVEIVASDISDAMLTTAQRGVYGTYSMRQVPPVLAARYFAVEDNLHVVKPDVKKLVRFANINLFDTARVKTMKGMDVIFCRNCLIYFDDKARKRVVDSFYDCLNPRGYLVIGFSESLHGLTRTFLPVPWNKTVVYQKV